MKRVMIFLEDEEHKTFKRACLEMNMPMSQVLRDFVLKYIEEDEPAEESFDDERRDGC